MDNSIGLKRRHIKKEELLKLVNENYLRGTKQRQKLRGLVMVKNKTIKIDHETWQKLKLKGLAFIIVNVK